MCDDEKALLRGIFSEPASDIRRLVYADFLEERGRGHRAVVIRAQVEAAGGAGPCSLDRHPTCRCDPLAGDEYRRCMKACDAELFGGKGRYWTAWDRGFVSSVVLGDTRLLGGPCRRCNGGFLMGVCDECAGEGRHLGEVYSLFANHPVTSVTLNTVDPQDDGHTITYGVFNNAKNVHPYPQPNWMLDVRLMAEAAQSGAQFSRTPLYLVFRFFDRPAAHSWLSRVLVAYGRRMAEDMWPIGGGS